MRTRWNSGVRSPATSESSPWLPAVEPPSFTRIAPNARSRSSWTAMTLAGSEAVLLRERRVHRARSRCRTVAISRGHGRSSPSRTWATSTGRNRTLRKRSARRAKLGHHHPAEVVPGALVPLSRVAEPGDQPGHAAGGGLLALAALLGGRSLGPASAPRPRRPGLLALQLLGGLLDLARLRRDTARTVSSSATANRPARGGRDHRP